jgi:general secretion pathway protein D
MKKMKNIWVKVIVVFFMMLSITNSLTAANCSNKLFSVTIDSKLSIGDVIENLANTCDLTINVKDDAAKQRMNKKLYYVKLKNSTLKGFLNTILKDNDLYYTLSGNKLTISYLITRTFRIHYISGQRTGKSNAHVTIANSNNAAASGADGGAGSSKTGISIESNDEFKFWKTVENEIQRVMNTVVLDGESGDLGGKEDTKTNRLTPIVNPEAGMVTVTGTQRQINRVAKYIRTLTQQIKSQVLIDVRILSVSFDDSKTTGVDWNQLYGLQNFTINSLLFAQQNVSGLKYEAGENINEFTYADNVSPSNAQAIVMNGSAKVSELVKFLGTQGDVKSISSPRVMTLNNQPALISVGKELFYKIKSSSTASSGGGAVASEGEMVDSVFAGILLDITPEIDTNGMVTLKINPSISDTVDSVKSNGGVRTIPPDLVRRQIASVIKVKDGQHAVLGGLISSKQGTKLNKVPLLGDLPLLGRAFKREEKINTVEELVLIITPHIIKNSKSMSLKDLGYSKLNDK